MEITGRTSNPGTVGKRPHSPLSRLSPIHKVVMSFAALILTGACLLMLPVSNSCNLGFVDALFTSTSAVCVTGLTVVDTEKDFTFFGQVVIMFLIQFGGLGIMSFTISLMALFGGSYSIKWRLAMESFYSEVRTIPARSVIKRIFLYTLTIEACTAMVLMTQFWRGRPFGEALWHSVFHSVSAFCNAGFSTFSDNIVGFQGNAVVILAISGAVILGGLGFFVLTELLNARHYLKPGMVKQFSLHTRLVLAMTAILLSVGTFGIFLLEWDHSFSGFDLKTGLLAAFFQSTSCRTAGFNSVDIGILRESTLLLMTVLMLIGGSPGSIAGGIKTTTFAAIIGLLRARMTGKKQVMFWGKALDLDTVDRAVTLSLLAGMFVFAMTFFVLFISAYDLDHRLGAVLFEVTSAFGTVGLSTGITPKLTPAGKLIVTLVMFVGRLGPLSLISALTSTRKETPYEVAEENIMIG